MQMHYPGATIYLLLVRRRRMSRGWPQEFSKEKVLQAQKEDPDLRLLVQ